MSHIKIFQSTVKERNKRISKIAIELNVMIHFNSLNLLSNNEENQSNCYKAKCDESFQILLIHCPR